MLLYHLINSPPSLLTINHAVPFFKRYTKCNPIGMLLMMEKNLQVNYIGLFQYEPFIYTGALME